ncbi:hypothetical protein FBU59_000068 [Linderina macrospora]|uniref:Uncharacterized protein n=1 Tax=Linderina macrospora TaxID=4868 RepID=A0ACC1JHN8_9FUNG|nr:hypothetical protein FBU59_000068 [Linderina macrospora]
MSRGRGRGRGGARREMSALQTELIGKSLFSKVDEESSVFPEYDVAPGKPPSKEETHIAQLLASYRQTLTTSMFYLQPPAPPRDIERFSDRFYTADANRNPSLRTLKTNLELFPDELHNVISAKKRVKKGKGTGDGSNGLLDALNGAKDDDEDEEKKEGEDDEEMEEVVEEEEEEENDYMDSYFDNGEADDIDGMDDDEGGGEYS